MKKLYPIIEWTEEGGYRVTCSGIPGVVARAETLRELLEEFAEKIEEFEDEGNEIKFS